MHILEQTQILPVIIETIWDFVQNPKNLDRITPPDLKFVIVNDVPEIMFDGLIIEISDNCAAIWKAAMGYRNQTHKRK